MRVLLLSDIHANLEAMDACIASAPPYDVAVNLGDIVGYGASPNEVTNRARDMGKVFVRGNHDKACTGLMSMQDFNPIAGMAALWTRNVLTIENLEFLRALPAGPVTIDALTGTQFVHGSPLDEDEYLIVVRDAVEPLMEATTPLTFFGHTHIQGGFYVEGEAWVTLRPSYQSMQSAETFSLPLKPEARYLINPGSVGQPRDGDPRAAFALYDSDKRTVTFHRVPYAIKGAQQRILDARLPERLAWRLSEGR